MTDGWRKDFTEEDKHALIEENKAANEKVLEDGIRTLLRGTRLLTFSEKAAVAERALRGFGFQARVIG